MLESCTAICRSCTSSSFYDCLSCIDGFYFVPNSEIESLGTCQLCHASCKTCTGPLETDCSSVKLSLFIDPVDKLVKSCPSNCEDCLSETNCLKCKFSKISIDGICSTTSNSISRCVFQYRNTSSGTDFCYGYSGNSFTGTDG